MKIVLTSRIRRDPCSNLESAQQRRRRALKLFSSPFLKSMLASPRHACVSCSHEVEHHWSSRARLRFVEKKTTAVPSRRLFLAKLNPPASSCLQTRSHDRSVCGLRVSFARSFKCRRQDVRRLVASNKTKFSRARVGSACPAHDRHADRPLRTGEPRMRGGWRRGSTHCCFLLSSVSRANHSVTRPKSQGAGRDPTSKPRRRLLRRPKNDPRRC